MPGEEIGRRPGPPAQAIGDLHLDLLVLVGTALAVQLVFPYRHDWPAHLLGGGGAMIALAALAPRSVRAATAAAGFVVVSALAWITEVRVFGPFDLVDISYTLAGALLAYPAAERVGRCDLDRRSALRWGGALVVAALAYRYGTSIGRR